MVLKICILIEKLNEGGAERSAGLLSKILTNLGHEVYFITIFDDVKYPFEGELANIGSFRNTSGSIKNKLNRYWQINKQLRKHKFDLFLDFRIKDSPLRELILNILMFKRGKMINMVRSFHLGWYFPKPKSLSKFIYKDYLGINTVSKDIKKHIENSFNFYNIFSIHSPIDIDYIKDKSNVSLKIIDNYIIAVGRLEPIKQFDKLIEAYSKTILPDKDIKLYILGNGSQKKVLENTIVSLNLHQDVILLPFDKNPFAYLKNAMFSVLTSKNEGFPRVLIESLACETPVVSFNCKSGPSEIVDHKKNGLLVNDQNFDELINAINEMVTNKELYKNCKENTLISVSGFSMSTIQNEWAEYLNKLSYDQSIH